MELLIDIHLYLVLANANMFYTLQREGMVTWDDIETTAGSRLWETETLHYAARPPTPLKKNNNETNKKKIKP